MGTLQIRLLAGLLAALVVAGVGWKLYSDIWDRGYNARVVDDAKALAEHIARAQAEARAIALQDAEVVQAGAATREKIRVVYQDREIEVVKNVEPNCMQCGLTSAGLRLLNDALTNAPRAITPDPRFTPAPVPGPSAPSGGNFPGRAPGDSEAVRKVL